MDKWLKNLAFCDFYGRKVLNNKSRLVSRDEESIVSSLIFTEGNSAYIDIFIWMLKLSTEDEKPNFYG